MEFICMRSLSEIILGSSHVRARSLALKQARSLRALICTHTNAPFVLFRRLAYSFFFFAPPKYAIRCVSVYSVVFSSSVLYIRLRLFAHFVETDVFFALVIPLYECSMRCSVQEGERTFVFCRQWCVLFFLFSRFVCCCRFFFSCGENFHFKFVFRLSISTQIEVNYCGDTRGLRSSLLFAICGLVITVVSEFYLCSCFFSAVLGCHLISNYQFQ